MAGSVPVCLSRGLLAAADGKKPAAVLQTCPKWGKRGHGAGGDTPQPPAPRGAVGDIRGDTGSLMALRPPEPLGKSQPMARREASAGLTPAPNPRGDKTQALDTVPREGQGWGRRGCRQVAVPPAVSSARLPLLSRSHHIHADLEPRARCQLPPHRLCQRHRAQHLRPLAPLGEGALGALTGHLWGTPAPH